ncbi:MAG: DoxX family membrane protein [Gemmatimonadales bacterium]|nr:DoxX family membrane protein [Gemmatimonadales bacterium]MYG20580.1 DoxX family membrane protein [Gemmatimonadales bacterium]
MNRELKAKAALTPRSWAAFVARMILGLIFFMAGFWKVFELGAVQHARGLFVEAYADTFLPAWSLWAAGVAIPFIELVCGALMLAGWRRRIATLGLGGVLILVTFGHLLAEPLYVFSAHVIPRTLLLVIVLLLFEDDRLSLDGWLARRAIPR